MKIDVVYLLSLTPTICSAFMVWLNVRRLVQESRAKAEAEREWRRTIDNKLDGVLDLVARNKEIVDSLTPKISDLETEVGDLRERVAVLESENSIWKTLYSAASKDVRILSNTVKTD